MAFHICPKHPPCRLQIPHFLLKGYSTRSFCKIEVHFLVFRIDSLPTRMSSSTRAFSSKSRSVQREHPSGRAGHPDNTCFGTSIRFTQCSAGIKANIIADDIRYTIPDIRLDNICYGG